MLKRNFKYFLFFFKYLKFRFFVLFCLSILTGILDSVGITLILPLLENTDKVTVGSKVPSSTLQWLYDFMHSLGFAMNVPNILYFLLLITVVKAVIVFVHSYFSVIFLQYFTRTLRTQSIDALKEFSFKHFLKHDAGALQNVLSGEVGRVVSAFNEYNKILQNVLMSLTYVGFAYFVNSQFAVFIILGGILFNLIYTLVFKKTKSISSKLVSGNNNYQKLLIQLISYYKYLKATNMVIKYTDYLKNEIIKIENNNKKLGLINALTGALREPLLYAILILVIVIQINVNHIALSAMMISLLLFYRGLGLVYGIQDNRNIFLSFSASLDNFQDFSSNLTLNKDVKGNIEFFSFEDRLVVQNITYSYREDENKKVLDDVSFEIQKNETVAFVGESGSGKSTLVNLLAGLLVPDGGTINLDGISFQKLNLSTLQSKIGYITQDSVIFDDTVFNNVTLWDEKTSTNLERYAKAMQKASIWEYFTNNGTNENTRLGNKGIRLSGGQIQRICIARELYKDVQFLFMDEATSALDSKTEFEVKNNIQNLKGTVTIIMIAHRLSTVKHADKIVVLNKGKVESIGTFEELMVTCSLFQSMIDLQEI